MGSNEDEEGGLESTLVHLTRVLWHWSHLEMQDAMEAVPGGRGGGGGRKGAHTAQQGQDS